MRITPPILHGRAAAPDATLPTFALPLWGLAHIAVGDTGMATMLAAAVLAQAPQSEGAAVKHLVAHLPERRLSRSEATEPGKWLRLGLRREQTERLLSIMGERRAIERVALGLYLLWDVARDDLDAWLGTRGMAAVVEALIIHAGHSLNLLDRRDTEPGCGVSRAELFDAYEQQASPAVRRHLLLCPACRSDVAALGRSADLVRNALDVFFRQPLPDNFADEVRAQRHTVPQPFNVPTVLIPVVLVVLLIAGLVLRPAAAAPTAAQRSQQAMPNVTDVLDHALNRFVVGPKRGVFHEQVRADSGEHEMIIERWFGDRQQLRITLRDPAAQEPVFDMSSDGTSWISYRLSPVLGSTDEALLQPPNIPALLPVLRQLPFVGSFGGKFVDQQILDVALLAQARHAGAKLLGSTHWHDRQAYLLSSIQPDRTRLLLLVDQNSFSLLRAQMIAPNNSTPRTVWQAEAVEEREVVPAKTFDPVSERAVERAVNPRQILSDLDLARLTDVTTSLNLPIPTALPEPPLSTQLLILYGSTPGVVQIYEGQWSTVAIMTPRLRYSLPPPEREEYRFKQGSYTVSTIGSQQVTLAEFDVDHEPVRRSAIYLWHALADDAERERMLVEILDNLEIANRSNADQFAQRFEAPVQRKPVQD